MSLEETIIYMICTCSESWLKLFIFVIIYILEHIRPQKRLIVFKYHTLPEEVISSN